MAAKSKPAATAPKPDINQDKNQAETAATGTWLRITSRQPGFRRAGISFGTEPLELDVATLSQVQIDQLKGEPMLVCVEVEAPAVQADE